MLLFWGDGLVASFPTVLGFSKKYQPLKRKSFPQKKSWRNTRTVKADEPDKDCFSANDLIPYWWQCHGKYSPTLHDNVMTTRDSN